MDGIVDIEVLDSREVILEGERGTKQRGRTRHISEFECAARSEGPSIKVVLRLPCTAKAGVC